MSSLIAVNHSAAQEPGHEGHSASQTREQSDRVVPSTSLLPDEPTKMVLPADPGSMQAASANIVSGKRQRKPTARATEQSEATNQARPRARPTPRSPRKSNKIVKRTSQENGKAKASPAPRSPAKKRPSPKITLRNTRATKVDYAQLMKDPWLSPKDLTAEFPDAPDTASRVRMLAQRREAAGLSLEVRAELAYRLWQQQQEEFKARKLAKEQATRKAYEANLEQDQMSEAAWILVAISNRWCEPSSTPGSPATSEATVSEEREVSPASASANCTPMPLLEEEDPRRDSVMVGQQLVEQDLAGSQSPATESSERSTINMR
ncbi:hypothetical protein HII31_05448 [Pseudocercospora fuligena]|uniref:Uncharacterized protein n=1 Tax=Pseudocercospora fuligena TaxID=685502 RepID=A0A8H6RM90_9PEZI|nr:hypothetical protein HII31_05448 [Pseudocercospora fuligena]